MHPRPHGGQGWRKGGLLSDLEYGGWIGTLPKNFIRSQVTVFSGFSFKLQAVIRTLRDRLEHKERRRFGYIQ